MRLKVKDMDIATGDVRVCLLNIQDARLWDLHHMDRIFLRRGKYKTTAVLDIAESSKAVPPGRVGLFEETLDALHAKHGDEVKIAVAKKPKSIRFIRKKLDGKILDYPEIHQIVKDVVRDDLTPVELTTYVTANYIWGMAKQEIIHLTKAMMATGTCLKFNHKPVADLHSIGGVPGNRTTMIVVPIIAAAGIKIPKTSSRAITSPSGTADTMEVLCNVSFSPKKLPKIMKDVGGFIIWGGGQVNLAPADDKIIKVEHPLSIDAEGQMIASIMAKKASVGSTHLLMEIPYGKGCKVETPAKAKHLEKQFVKFGKLLGIKTNVMIVDGSQPVGNGIGPVLECKDVLNVLMNDPKGPQDLKIKSIHMAGQLLEHCGKAKKGKGHEKARQLLEDGSAYEKFAQMVKAQGGRMIKPEKLRVGRHVFHYRAKKTGKIKHIDNVSIARIARVAGAPHDPEAGIYLYKRRGDKVSKGEVLFKIFSDNPEKLQYSIDLLQHIDGILIS